MAPAGAKARLVVFVVLSAALAFMVMATLLLVGVEPRLVFAPGFTVRAWCQALGFHASNRVGVLSTGLFYWAVIVAVWLATRKLAHRSTA